MAKVRNKRQDRRSEQRQEEQTNVEIKEVRDSQLSDLPSASAPSLSPTPTPQPSPTDGGECIPSPQVVVRFEAERLEAIKSSAQKLLKKMLDVDSGEAVWTLREAVWPALSLREFQGCCPKLVELTLLPLSRIGQMEGKSGSLVLVGYFSAPELKDLHSHPLVIKTRDRNKTNPERLGEEFSFSRAFKPFVYDHKDSFAIPISFDDKQHGFDVLWSICSLSKPNWDTGSSLPNPAEPFKIEDLRNPLHEGKNADVKDTLDEVYNLLLNCHRRFNRAGSEQRMVGEEYKWYLRGFGFSEGAETKWGPPWVEMWGGPDAKFVGEGESGPVNPLWLVEQLRPLKFPMYVGAIHGDLHPGNIVYKRIRQPAVIDFGWAQDKAHVSKDFVLMECNLRFLTLRLEIRDQDLDRFASWVAWNEPLPGGLGDYIKGRGELVQMLRQKAAEVFPSETDWNREYLVPLFLVAFGLLRFAPQLGNQMAAVRLVLALAQHIRGELAL